MEGVSDVLHILADLSGIPVVPALPRDPEVRPRQICAETRLATELLDFSPRVSLTGGLARVVHSMARAEQLDAELAPIGPDQ
jgi:hypothetical protein